jgi:hypothetical protein
MRRSCSVSAQRSHLTCLRRESDSPKKDGVTVHGENDRTAQFPFQRQRQRRHPGIQNCFQAKKLAEEAPNAIACAVVDEQEQQIANTGQCINHCDGYDKVLQM